MAHDDTPTPPLKTEPVNGPARPDGDELRASRRRLLKRTVVVGLPVVLASVKGRNAWAQSGGSMSPSLTGSGTITP